RLAPLRTEGGDQLCPEQPARTERDAQRCRECAAHGVAFLALGIDVAAERGAGCQPQRGIRIPARAHRANETAVLPAYLRRERVVDRGVAERAIDLSLERSRMESDGGTEREVVRHHDGGGE